MHDFPDHLHASARRVDHRTHAKYPRGLVQIGVIRRCQIERGALLKPRHHRLGNREQNAQRRNGGDPEENIVLLHFLRHTHRASTYDSCERSEDARLIEQQTGRLKIGLGSGLIRAIPSDLGDRLVQLVLDVLPNPRR